MLYRPSRVGHCLKTGTCREMVWAHCTHSVYNFIEHCLTKRSRWKLSTFSPCTTRGKVSCTWTSASLNNLKVVHAKVHDSQLDFLIEKNAIQMHCERKGIFYLWLALVDAGVHDVTSQSKVRHLTHHVLAHQHVTGGQVAVHALQK